MYSRRKGQVEFIVVAALIVIGIAVVILASRQAIITPPVMTGVTEEAKTVRDSVTSLIRAGVKENIEVLYNQGGLLNVGPSVKFGMFDTSIWSFCGETNIPDVASELNNGLIAYLNQYLRDNLDANKEMEFSGVKAKFDFDSLDSKVEIIKDRVVVRVNLPTKIGDYDIEQPYEISVNTKLYDVLDFSKNFAGDVGQNKNFELCTINTMQQSEAPMMGVISDCGKIVHKTRAQALPIVKDVATYVISHTVWNKPPLYLEKNVPCPPLNSVGGKTYPGLEVAFAYPPSWDSQMDRYFNMYPDPAIFAPQPINMIFSVACMTPYAIFYSFRYPVIVMVEDSTLNKWFKFAMMTEIQNNEPGSCFGFLEQESDYNKRCVEDVTCDAKIKVKDSEGKPVEGADVIFSLCNIGTTNQDGEIESKIPCIVSNLRIYKEGYRSFGESLVSFSDMIDKNATLEKTAGVVTVHLKGLRTQAYGKEGDGKYGNYQITESSTDITDLKSQLLVMVTFTPTNPDPMVGTDLELIAMNQQDEEYISQVSLEGLQPIGYNVTASVQDMSNETSSFIVSSLSTSFELKEGEKDVYVYLPVVLKTDTGDIQSPGIDMSETSQLTEVAISRCGAAASTTERSC